MQTSTAATAAPDPVHVLTTTRREDAALIVWLGGHDVPFGYWPTDDRDACTEAVREWVQRDTSIFSTADDEDADSPERVERYMSAISVDALRVYELRCCEDGETITIRAFDDADSRKRAEAWIRKGSWDEGRTVWVDVEITDDQDMYEVITVTIDPPEPSCSEDEHDWRSPHELVGGIESNPGVWFNTGRSGMTIREVCSCCGIYRVTDTGAQRPDTGEQGLTSVRYLDATDESREWVASLAEDDSDGE